MSDEENEGQGAQDFENRMLRDEVLADDIADVIAVWTGIPVSKLMETERERVLNMADKLRERVVGQDEAIEIVTDAIQRSRAGLNDPSKPIASLIFLGPTGVGKTELAKALSEFMFDTEDALIRLDMITDSKGNHVDFKNTIIIFTSNIGSQDIIELGGAEGDQALMKERVEHAMRAHFRPEFLNRVDSNVIFNSLGFENLRGIVVLETRRLENRLAERSMKMIITDEALDLLAEMGFDPIYGARPLKRTIQSELENNIALGILQGDYEDGDTIMIGVMDGQISIRKAYDWEAMDNSDMAEDADVSMSSGFY
ncbi:hypothetical protein ACHAXS_001274 [Conticribra weissflogii]